MTKEFTDLLNQLGREGAANAAAIDALEKANADRSKRIETLNQMLAEKNAQIEELQSRLDDAQPGDPDDDTEVGDSPLSTQYVLAVGLLTTLHPAMRIDVNDPIGMARQIIDHVKHKRPAVDVAALAAQNERLVERLNGMPAGINDVAAAGAAMYAALHAITYASVEQTTIHSAMRQWEALGPPFYRELDPEYNTGHFLP